MRFLPRFRGVLLPVRMPLHLLLRRDDMLALVLRRGHLFHSACLVWERALPGEDVMQPLREESAMKGNHAAMRRRNLRQLGFESGPNLGVCVITRRGRHV